MHIHSRHPQFASYETTDIERDARFAVVEIYLGTIRSFHASAFVSICVAILARRASLR